MVALGRARMGTVRHGSHKHVAVRPGGDRLDVAVYGAVYLSNLWHAMFCYGGARSGNARQGLFKQVMARLGLLRHGEIWSGLFW